MRSHPAPFRRISFGRTCEETSVSRLGDVPFTRSLKAVMQAIFRQRRRLVIVCQTMTGMVGGAATALAGDLSQSKGN